MLRDTVIFVLWALTWGGCGVASLGPADLGAETHDLAEPWDDGGEAEGTGGGTSKLLLNKCLSDGCPEELNVGTDRYSNPVR